MKKLIVTYAVLAWIGHGVALYAVLRYAWGGFLLAAALDLPLQFGLMYWLWGEAMWRFRQWRKRRALRRDSRRPHATRPHVPKWDAEKHIWQFFE